ncbi:MAG: S-methyl-5-thioribose-1-phosphate isomerase [Candidatus Cloacimonetes bacterium]|nr:S-methyl-5-thioribose-1-phosphate isomerase [Candidatus Cloacimonadota bacterium]MBS3767685.1 S-methyl-5-thioribose-1-phosphate isomerase [Candidatus Cloacimonadota bacterium]
MEIDLTKEVIRAENKNVVIINQTKLPHKLEFLTLKNCKETAQAIKNMNLRGAGTVGVASGYAMAQAFSELKSKEKILEAKEFIENTRPTAQNLFYATNLVYKTAIDETNSEKIAWDTADSILASDIEATSIMGKLGAELIEDNYSILTHCNAGKLAIQGYGSALAPIYYAHEQKKNCFVYVDETRPRLQGARLTAWELAQENIDHAIIVDNAAGYYFQKGKIDIVFVGADRIAGNGDVANKIGTYEKAVLAKENDVPFYVVAPQSTIDTKTKSGSDIIIEHRSQDEVKNINSNLIANEKSKAFNPAFDITPAKYITGIITENGNYKPDNLYNNLCES